MEIDSRLRSPEQGEKYPRDNDLKGKDSENREPRGAAHDDEHKNERPDAGTDRGEPARGDPRDGLPGVESDEDRALYHDADSVADAKERESPENTRGETDNLNRKDKFRTERHVQGPNEKEVSYRHRGRVVLEVKRF